MRRIIGAAGVAILLYLGVMFFSARIHWTPYERPAGALAVSPSAFSAAFASYNGDDSRSVDRQAAPMPRGIRGASVTGALHVHTERSHDSHGTVEEVARAARTTDLDFVLISDHPSRVTPDADVPEAPYYLDGVLLVDGREINFGRDIGRVLVFGVDTTLTRWEKSVDDFAELLRRRGGTAIAVHPRSPLRKEAWHHESLPGIAGWEAFDLSDIARHRAGSASGPYHLLSLLAGLPLGFGDASLRRLHRNGFRYPGAAGFDSLSVRQPLTAVAGANVHPRRWLGGRTLIRYEPFFRAFANHLALGGALPADPLAARDSIAAALDEGRAYISFGETERARSFVLGVESEGVVVGEMGEGVYRKPGMVLSSKLLGDRDERLKYRVVRNGHTAAWVRGRELAWEIVEPGAYRVEVYRYTGAVGPLTWNLRPWIFSNPIHVVEGEDPARSREIAL